MEANVFFTPGTSYSYTVGMVDSQGDALTMGAAWLYSQFAKGTLAGYDYNNNGSVSRNTDDGILQAALWALQGQSGGSSFPSGTVTNAFYTLAATTLGTNLETLAAKDQYGVELLNLSDSSQNAAQGQLVYTGGVPDGGTTLALMGLGLVGLAGASVGFRPSKLALQTVRGSRPAPAAARVR
jgi:hypothetical protein